MSKNLFEFTNEKIYDETDNKLKEDKSQNKISENQSEFIKQKFSEYSGKSESELMAELFSTVNQQKNNGTFEIEKLYKMIDTIAPYLDEKQVNNLKGLLNKLK